MITPDEPWMCGNLTTMPYSREEPGTRGGAGVGGGQPGDLVGAVAAVSPI